jgi:hypothetical protein
MTEITYGFVDDNNILQQFAVVTDGDLETIERIKSQFALPNGYPMNLEKEYTLINETYWNGVRFLHPSPYLSWVFNEDINNWEPPVPYPTIEEGSDESYVWDENTISWLLLPPA